MIVGAHSVTSGVRVGGSYVHTFTKPGTYNYTDSRYPHAKGIIEVGNEVKHGNNFDMHIGGVNTLPFDPNTNNSFVLRFVPTTVSIPPAIAITYNITITAATSKLVKTVQQYDDRDGMLDLELNSIATPGGNGSQHPTSNAFTTWGPDYEGQTGYQTTGTFHIQGPMLNKNDKYFITITMVSKDDKTPSNKSIADPFVLLPKGG